MLLRRFSSRSSSQSSSRSSARLATRLVVTAVASAAALAVVPAAAHADTGPTRMPPPPFSSLDGPTDPTDPTDPTGIGGPGSLGGFGRDHLTVSVADTGGHGDGTYQLECGPAGGTHADPAAACDRLDELADNGRDPFAPVPKGTYCTMQYGGSATAHITGVWHGRAVDASYKLTDGCEISRWRALVPVLPATSP